MLVDATCADTNAGRKRYMDIVIESVINALLDHLLSLVRNHFGDNMDGEHAQGVLLWYLISAKY